MGTEYPVLKKETLTVREPCGVKLTPVVLKLLHFFQDMNLSILQNRIFVQMIYL